MAQTHKTVGEALAAIDTVVAALRVELAKSFGPLQTAGVMAGPAATVRGAVVPGLWLLHGQPLPVALHYANVGTVVGSNSQFRWVELAPGMGVLIAWRDLDRAGLKADTPPPFEKALKTLFADLKTKVTKEQAITRARFSATDNQS